MSRMNDIITSLRESLVATSQDEDSALMLRYVSEDEDYKRITAWPAVIIQQNSALTESAANTQLRNAEVILNLYCKYERHEGRMDSLRTRVDALESLVMTNADAFGATEWLYGGWRRRSGETEKGENVEIAALTFQVKYREKWSK